MRTGIRGIGAALLTAAAAGMGLHYIVPASEPGNGNRRSAGKTYPHSSWRTTGKTYPHSSLRQQARYARQIAAGQLTASNGLVVAEGHANG